MAQADRFRVNHETPDLNPGWHLFQLPADIYQYATPRLSDIRLYKKGSNVEAPYFVRSKIDKTQKTKLASTIINKSTDAQGSYSTIQLSEIEDIQFIHLNLGHKNFDWKIRVQGSQNNEEWYTIIDDHRILSHNTGKIKYNYTDIPLPTSRYRYYRILFKGVDDLKIASADMYHLVEYPGDYHVHSGTLISTEKNATSQMERHLVEMPILARYDKISLVLSGADDYYRRLKIEYQSDSTFINGKWLYQYSTLVDGYASSMEPLKYVLNPPKLLRRLRISLYHYDDRPLSLDEVQAYSSKKELVTKISDPGIHTLAYGNPEYQKPRYDITQFESKIPSSIVLRSLGNPTYNEVVQDISDHTASSTSSTWIWIILGLVILLLGWSTIKMIRHRSKETD